MKRRLIFVIFIAAFLGIGYYFVGLDKEPGQLTIGLVPSGNPETMKKTSNRSELIWKKRRATKWLRRFQMIMPG